MSVFKYYLNTLSI